MTVYTAITFSIRLSAHNTNFRILRAPTMVRTYEGSQLAEYLHLGYRQRRYRLRIPASCIIIHGRYVSLGHYISRTLCAPVDFGLAILTNTIPNTSILCASAGKQGS
jgi:hypothetical protein